MNDNISSLLRQTAADLRRNSSLAGCFDNLRHAADLLGAPSLKKEIDDTESRYYYLLRFVGQNGSFTADKDVDDIRRATGVLLEKAVSLMHESDTASLKGSQLRYQRRRPEENLESLVSDLLSEQDRLRTDPLALTDSRANTRLEQIATDIFKRIWASDPVSADEERLLDTLIGDKTLPFHFRMHIVHAIGLGMERHIQSWRLRLLRSAMASENRRIAIGAEIWTVLAIALSEGKSTTDIALPHIADIYHALVRTAAPTSDELPNLMSMGRRMKDNPLGDPNLSPDEYEAVRRVQEAQTRGEDVFAATLGRMRQFPFFHETANWFLPFHSSHSALAEIVDGEGAAIADMIERIPVLTDADKYAMVLSIAAMPSAMRSRALAGMVDSIRKVSDSDEFREALSASEPTEKMIVGQTVTTICRYLTDNSEGRRHDIAGTLRNAANSVLHLLPDDIDNSEEYSLINDLCHRHEYQAALNTYESTTKNGAEPAATLRALGDASWAMGKISEAYDFYGEALRRDPSDADALLGIARINRHEGRQKLNVSLLEPHAAEYADNIGFQKMLGYAYIADGNIEKAIETFHHLDYISNDTAAKEPLAWTLTLAGDYDNAAIFFEEAAAGDVSENFLIKKGIMQWLSGDRSAALDTFAQVREKTDQSAFETTFGPLSAATGDAGIKAGLMLAPEIIRYRYKQ